MRRITHAPREMIIPDLLEWSESMLLQDKRIAIFNIANKHSIAWAIAKAMDAQGAELILGYQNERSRGKVEALLGELSRSPLALVQCDVTDDEEISAAAAAAESAAGQLDGLVHALAFAPKEALENPFIETSREAFATAMDVSVFSLLALCKAFQPLLSPGSGVLTLTYYGAEKVIPNYNVMGVAKAALEASVRYLANDLGPQGVRVNAVSAGPINTLAARGVSGFLEILDHHAGKAPLRRNVESREVGDAACFLVSSLASGITGEVLYVDTGFNIMGI